MSTIKKETGAETIFVNNPTIRTDQIFDGYFTARNIIVATLRKKLNVFAKLFFINI